MNNHDDYRFNQEERNSEIGAKVIYKTLKEALKNYDKKSQLLQVI
ncbi:6-carboxytetrahydropterin synthase QueD, partial [Staphylococcus pseudintermedius]